MDISTTMSNKWIPSRVALDEELPVMLDAPFASIKQENYYEADSKVEVTRASMSEWDKSVNCGRNTASIKQENYYQANSNEEVTRANMSEWDNSVNRGTIKSIDNKTGLYANETCVISPMRINHRAQVDVIDMQAHESNGYKHVLIYEEQYSKFIVLKALKSVDPGEVATKLVDIVTTIGAPRIIQSGNGRDYAEQVVREIRVLLRDFCVVHGDATKNVEVRRNFKTILKSWMTKNPGRTLHDGLRTVQVAENTTANSRNGKVPSQLFFGRNICEDLRRAIGAKGPMGNALAEEETILKSKQDKLSGNDMNGISVVTAIAEIERIDRSSAANENVDSFNVGNVKNAAPIVLEKITEIDSSEKTALVEKDNFGCKICQKRYMKLGHLRNHMKTHTRIGSFECTICSKSYRLSSLYDKHMERFHHRKKKNDGDGIIERLRQRITNNEEEYSDSGTKKACPTNEKSEEPTIEENNKKKSSLRSFGRKPLKRSKSMYRNIHKNDSTTSKLNASPLLECTYCKQKFNFPSVLKRHMRSHTNERPYVCQVCSKSFKQLGHLSQHSLTHTDYRSFQCTICAIKFDSLDALKLHSQTHKDDPMVYRSKEIYRLFECDSCKKVFTTKSVLERHIFTHTHERQFGCKICGKRFKQAGHVKSHMLVHTGERKFACTICPKRFSLSNSLKKHMYVHNGEKPYQCDVCGARFLEKRNLNGHMMTHTNERPFSCKICGKRYTLADTLRRHISAAHEDGRTYQCEICAKMFKQLAHLSVHKKVHNDDRPFQCHLCEKNFKHKNVLKSHLAIHANVRPFECDVCKATFVRKTNLQTHIASAHMNERPYVCTICNKRFKQISHLNGHIVVHSNSMPYKCDFCDRRCNRLDNLKKHMRLHAKNKEQME